MLYGFRSLSVNGGSLIAVYNVLNYLTKKDIDFPLIIKTFENDGIIYDGKLGTSMKAVDDYFKKNGFNIWSSMNQKDYDTIAKATDATILSFYFGYGNTDISKKIHFVAITKENGKYYVHNNGDNSYKIAYNSITDVLNKINSGKVKQIYLTGIYKK